MKLILCVIVIMLLVSPYLIFEKLEAKEVKHGVTFSDITDVALNRVFNTRTYGVCINDYNSDGYEDIYISNHRNLPTLLRNNHDSSFSLETSLAGLYQKNDSHGSTWGDYDNDGDLDLYQAVGNGGQFLNSNLLFYNNGSTFIEVAEQAGVSDASGRGRSVGWLDYDNDGSLDLFVANANRIDGPNVLFHNNGESVFTNVSYYAGVSDTTAQMGLSFADYNMDGWMDIFLTGVSRVYLYRNLANGLFQDVTVDSGIKNIKNALGSAWGDYDNDGDLDLFVTTSNGHGDAIYVDSDKILFETSEKIGEDGLRFVTSGESVTFDLYFLSDHTEPERIFVGANGMHPLAVPFTLTEHSGLDTRGKPEIPKNENKAYLIWQDDDGNWFISQKCRCLISATPQVFRGTITSSGTFTDYQTYDYEFRPDTSKNYLFENQGEGTFKDVTVKAGLEDNLSSQSALWADFDNDGNLDLYIVNNGDILNEANSFYVNNGDGAFTDYAQDAGVEALSEGNGESASFGDINNDGFLDIVVTNGLEWVSGPYLIFQNNGNVNNWIKIKLIGDLSNRDGIGTKVFLETTAGSQYREQNGGSHLRSQNSMIVHFGLGDVTTIAKMKVVWPSGVEQIFYDVIPNQFLEIQESL